ncbi:hypothetical protein [Kineothrix sp. MB12-C1]|uniref:hypothetical protein n=1 Tax=Kineothrix sp. MB12-C1 TaxID=3070215 RepID=UPI0027D32A48|nr:hypothetical protein [Kineothrix sp. MB12-C1]WMC91303.1 hypothetical protein RBB56_10445 [Kineothrix sp. MB12-C1]
MSWFDILIGISSIGSFIVSIVALFKVDKIEKHIVKDYSNKTSQTIKRSKINNSDIRQIGRDNKDH